MDLDLKQAMDCLSEKELHAIHRACCSFQGARERWAQLAESGATDAELIERLKYELSIEGSSSGPGRVSERHKGKPSPTIWLHWYDHDDTETLRISGKWLLSIVRRMYGIHDRVLEGQLALFEAA